MAPAIGMHSPRLCSIGTCVLLPLLLGSAGCAAHAATAAAGAHTAAIPVTTAQARQTTVTRVLETLGTVTPLQDVAITVRVDGLLEAIPAQEGQEVAQGAILARLDERPYAAACRQQEALVARDRAQLVEAQADLARSKALAGGGMLAKSALDQAQAQADALRASLAGDEAGADAARLNLSFTTVRAPFAGMVSLRRVDAGAVVHTTDTGGILTLTQLDPISLIIPLGQEDLPALRLAAARPSWRAQIRARSGELLAEASLAAIDTHVDPTTGEVRCRLAATNPHHLLWPGAFVVARLPLEEATGTAVPTAALQRTQEGWTLWCVDAGQRAELRSVATGLSAGGWTIVTDGVAAGARVVIAGQVRLSAGVQVDAQPGAGMGVAPSHGPTTATVAP